ncbi:hypothetical protein FIE12Z_12686 [Fusarium flagelliforme]|uniref:Uncharacterized protein n=1 Tax=Fusarium flagelliforme TaxID=2675880 RepID=A0A395M5C5_9HYPO|nr:hypothetical protein FIE12Z_12686 [Fusarium flagelliforme]
MFLITWRQDPTVAFKFRKVDQAIHPSIVEKATKVKHFTTHRDRQNGLQVRRLQQLPIILNQNGILQTLPEGSSIGLMD